MRTIAITIDEETLERVDKAAAAARPRGTANRSRIIRAAVRDHLARLDRMAEEERERDILRRHARRLTRQAAALVNEQAKL